MLFEDKLGGYFPKENKQLEFKEFCLKTPLDIYISPQEASMTFNKCDRQTDKFYSQVTKQSRESCQSHFNSFADRRNSKDHLINKERQ